MPCVFKMSGIGHTLKRHLETILPCLPRLIRVIRVDWFNGGELLMSFRAKLDVIITLFLVDSGCVTEYSTWLKRSSTQGIKAVVFQFYRIRKHKFYLLIFNILNICTSSGQIFGVYICLYTVRSGYFTCHHQGKYFWQKFDRKCDKCVNSEVCFIIQKSKWI